MKNSTLKISAVSYVNSRPFVYGIENAGLLKDYTLSLDTPSECADKLIQKKVDLGLIPIATIPKLKEYFILPDFCIGANGPVTTVILYSDVPLKEIKTIILDNQSRTSAQLVRVLAKYFWKVPPEWIDAKDGYEKNIKGTTAGLVIGDRNFSLSGKHKHAFDLAEEWKLFTGLPFVFACWVANRELSDSLTIPFYKSLLFGIDNREVVIKQLSDKFDENVIRNYLNKYIYFSLDSAKRIAMDLFLKLSAKLN